MQIVSCGILGRAVAGTDRAALTFPAALALADGSLVATLRAGSAKDAPDERIEVYRSSDQGETWSGPENLPAAPLVAGRVGSLKLCYLTELGPGRLIAAAMWVDRTSFPGRPLFNPQTEGCLPMAIVLARSHDGGQSWSDWSPVPMPAVIGPPSLTGPILRLADGRLAMSIETNKTYLDATPWKQRAVYLHSADQGRTWSDPVTVAEDPTGRIFNWDLRAAVAPDGRIASFAWTFDSQTGSYRDIHRRISGDGGLTWTAPVPIGLADQAARPAIRADGSLVLAWVDRFASRSIRARLAPALDAPFDPASDVTLYSHGGGETPGQDTAKVLAAMDLWSFGLPFAEVLADGDVLVLYYAGDPAAMDVHRVRLRPG